MDQKPRVVMMGTPDFAVPSLKALAQSGAYDVVAVVTQPDRPKGRKLALTPPPLKEAAESLGIPVLQPLKVRAKESLETLVSLRPDVIVTAAYGQILPQALLDIPRVGCLNVHASLLPRWRGAAPIHRSILAGDQETGVTIMEMVLALDAGPMVGVKKVPITAQDNVGSLHDKLALAGAEILLDTLPGYLSGAIQPVAQPEDGVTYAERITREDEWISWSLSAKDVHNRIRGLSPWPGASTFFQGAPLKIWSASLADQTVNGEMLRETSEPGTALVVEGAVFVRAKDGWLKLHEVQPANKKRMSAEAWANGLKSSHVRFEEAGLQA